MHNSAIKLYLQQNKARQSSQESVTIEPDYTSPWVPEVECEKTMATALQGTQIPPHFVEKPFSIWANTHNDPC